MASFDVVLASPPDRDNVVAEIYSSSVQFAEIRDEGGRLHIQIYPSQPGLRFWDLPFEELLAAPQRAGEALRLPVDPGR